jgi:hypothetical protein
MSLLTGEHTFHDQFGKVWILKDGVLRLTPAGRVTEAVFADAETRTLETGAEELLLYSPTESPGFLERMQIRYGGAHQHFAELRINTERHDYQEWELQAQYRLSSNKNI